MKTSIPLYLFYIVLNRTSYSGIVKAGPLGGKKQQSQNKIDCRFNKQNLKNKIKNLGQLSPRVEVSNMDGIQFMKEITRTNEDVFIYADPPYYKVGKLLYNQYFNDSKHIELADYLKQVDEQPWLLSYNNTDFILELYSDKKMVPIFLDYHSGPYRRNIKEYLFSNRVIPPFEIRNEIKKGNIQEDSSDCHFTISGEA